MKREYLKKIFKVLNAINDPWVLHEVYRFAVNITKREDGAK